MQDRSEQVIAAAETVASWARARRAAWTGALAADASVGMPFPAAPQEEEAEEPFQSVSDMLTSLVMNAEFRKTPTP